MPNQPTHAGAVPTIEIAQWLPVLACWAQPTHILLVGGGSTEQALALAHTEAQVVAVDFQVPLLNGVTQAAQPRLRRCQQLLAATDGPHMVHHYSHAPESGLVPLEALSPYWPHLRAVRTEESPALSVDSFCARLPQRPEWLWLDCHPAVPLLSGASQTLASAEVVLVRVATRSHDSSTPSDQTFATLTPSDLASVQATLGMHRLRLAGVQPERNPDWATALFVRDHAAEAAETRVTLGAQLDVLAKACADAEAAAVVQQAELKHAHQKALADAQAEATARYMAQQDALLDSQHQVKALQADKGHCEQKLAELKAIKDSQDQLIAELLSQKQANDLVSARHLALERSLQGIETRVREVQSNLPTHFRTHGDELIRARKYLDAVIRQEVGNAKRQVEAALGLQSYFQSGTLYEVNLEKNTWPISPDFAHLLVQLIEFNDYELVIEFGSGISTVILARAMASRAKKLGKPADSKKVVSFDHLEQYLQQTARDLERAGLSELVALHLAPLSDCICPNGITYPYYDCTQILASHALAQSAKPARVLVVVDGPPAATGTHARYPALPLVLQHFPDAQLDFLMDDFVREDEKQIGEMWQSCLREQGFVFTSKIYQFEKGALLLSCTQKKLDHDCNESIT